MSSQEWIKLPDEVKKIITRYHQKPPVLLGEIAQALNLTVKRATLPPGISGEIKTCPVEESKVGYIIRINRHESKKRQRFTLAHEIAHFLLHKKDIGNGIEDDILYRSNLSQKSEIEANRLAADIVMPWNLIEEKLEYYKDLDPDYLADTIAQDLEVSSTAMEIRLNIK